MKLTEDKLNSALRAGRFERLYFLYGKEPFLIQMYVDKIIRKTVGDDALDFNLQRLEGCPEPDLLSDMVDTLPVFAEVKVVTVKDFDPEKFVAATEKKYHEIASNVPDSAILVLYCVNVDIDEKKNKTKKFIDTVDKSGGVVCSIDLMPAPRIAELCVRKAVKDGIVISQDDGLFLTERTGSRMNVASDETAKLMSYVGKGGTITREHIDMLVPKQLEAEVFDLANAINSGRRADSYRIIDELFSKQINAVSIMGAMSGTFLDMYCAKLAKNAGLSSQAASGAFGYFGGKAWAFGRSYTAAVGLDIAYLRETVKILSETDIALKSVPVDGRVLVEETVTKLFMCREKRRR